VAAENPLSCRWGVVEYGVRVTLRAVMGVTEALSETRLYRGSWSRVWHLRQVRVGALDGLLYPMGTATNSAVQCGCKQHLWGEIAHW
jgi:hypothetical protein